MLMPVERDREFAPFDGKPAGPLQDRPVSRDFIEPSVYVEYQARRQEGARQGVTPDVYVEQRLKEAVGFCSIVAIC
jgi:hypothetical protein